MNYRLLCLLIGITALCGRVARAADQTTGLDERVERLTKTASSSDGDTWSLSQAYRDLFTHATTEQVEQLTSHENLSVALAAGWEKVRRTVPMRRSTYNSFYSSDFDPRPKDGEELVYDKAAVSRFLKLVRERTELAVPDFWEKALLEPDLTTRVDVPMVRGDRPAGIERVQNQWVVTLEAGQWFLPVVQEADDIDQCPDAVRLKMTRKTAYLVIIESYLLALVPYRLYALDRENGRILWSARIRSHMEPFPPGVALGGWVDTGYILDLEADDNWVAVLGITQLGRAYIETFTSGRNECRFSTGFFNFPNGAEPTALSDLDGPGGGSPIIGPAGSAAISELPLLMKASDPHVRAAAAWAAGSPPNVNQVEGVRSLLPGLSALLNDEDGHIRAVAAWSLGELRVGTRESDPNAKSAILALTERLRDKDWHVRAMAARALWTTADSDKSKTNPAIPALTELLHDKIGHVRAAAAETLGRISVHAAIPLAGLLKDEDGNVRAAAAEALRSIERTVSGTTLREQAVPLIPALTELLSDKDPTVRAAAAQALQGMVPEANAEVKAAVPTLIRLLKDADVTVRGITAKTLGRMGSEAKAAVPALTELLKENDWRIRSVAADALGEIGPDARSAVPALVALLKSKDWYVCNDVGSVLQQIEAGDSSAAIAQLRDVMRDRDRDVRAIAVSALWGMGADASPAIPELTELLNDTYWYARLKAAETLGRLGPQAKSAVPALAARLKDRDTCVRVAAAEALEEIGPQAKSAIPALKELLEYKNEQVHWAANRALQKIESANP